MGSSVKNLDKLIKMPSGCGEQNMLNFVPCIVAINYLKNTGQLTKSIESKALKFMELGYQRELTYKHDDGSFSAFGKSDDSGSTWLTAFVVRSFLQARRHIMVESSIITKALDWLNDKQVCTSTDRMFVIRTKVKINFRFDVGSGWKFPGSGCSHP